MATFTAKRSKKQLSVVEKLIHQADTLVNAGDPDREGQLLVMKCSVMPIYLPKNAIKFYAA